MKYKIHLIINKENYKLYVIKKCKKGKNYIMNYKKLKEIFE